MNFREEYKNSIEIMSPSAEQMVRMKKNIMEQVKAPEKKTIPFKKIAYIGSAVAACAVISVAAINIIPRLSGGSSLATADSMSSCADIDMNYMADGAAAVGGAANEDFNADDAGMEAEVKAESAHPLTTSPAINEAVAEDVAGDADFDACEDVYDDACGDMATDSVGSSIADVIDSITDETFAPSNTTAKENLNEPMVDEDCPASDEVHQPVEGAAEEIVLFELSAELDILMLDDVKYILYDDGNTPREDYLYYSRCFLPDGTEYWLDYYENDYIILSTRDEFNDFVIVGGYKKAE